MAVSELSEWLWQDSEAFAKSNQPALRIGEARFIIGGVQMATRPACTHHQLVGPFLRFHADGHHEGCKSRKDGTGEEGGRRPKSSVHLRRHFPCLRGR